MGLFRFASQSFGGESREPPKERFGKGFPFLGWKLQVLPDFGLHILKLFRGSISPSPWKNRKGRRVCGCSAGQIRRQQGFGPAIPLSVRYHIFVIGAARCVAGLAREMIGFVNAEKKAIFAF